MNYLKFGGLLLLAALFPLGVYAQKLNPKEQKQLIKELQRLYLPKNIGEYKAMKDQLAKHREIFAQYEKEIKQKNKELDKTNSELQTKIQEEKDLLAEIEKVKADLSKGTYTYEPRKNQPEFKCETAGTVYKVQFELTDAELYREVAEGNKTIVFSGDVDEDGKKKYTIACFSEKEEADEFLQYLQGIKIPCILTTYVDGKKTN